MIFKGTAKVVYNNDWYTATCLENGIVSQGKTPNEAIENLKEALELYYEDDENVENYMPIENVFFTTLEVPLNA